MASSSYPIGAWGGTEEGICRVDRDSVAAAVCGLDALRADQELAKPRSLAKQL